MGRNSYRTLLMGSLCVVMLQGGVAQAGKGTFTAGTPNKLNLSVYFDYDERDPDSWKPLFERGSQLLYNATEKQVQLGNVTAFKNCTGKKDEADIIISNTNDGASANPGGLGKNGWHVYLSQTHKSTIGSALGQFGLVHELGHYVFNLRDEYLGTKKYTRVPDGMPVLTSPKNAFFCVLDDESGHASIMDGGTTTAPRNSRTEFCTRSSGSLTTKHESGYATGVTTKDGVRMGTVVTNAQHGKHGESAWQTMVKTAATYGIKLTEPTSEPVNDTAGHQAINFEVQDCSPKVVLVIDRSGSMTTDNRMGLAKAAASAVVDAMKNGAKVALVSFSDLATVDAPVLTLSDTNRATLKSAINNLAASGSTNIGGGMRAGLNVITAAQPRTGNEAIILLTDGEHNVGEQPQNVVPDIKAQKVKLHNLGLGSGVNVSQLQQMANEAGGEAHFAATANELSGILVPLALKPQGNFPIKNIKGTVARGAQSETTVLIDSFTTEAIFTAAWDNGSLDVILIDPSGNQVSRSGKDFTESARSESYVVASPVAGTWKVRVTASSANTQDAAFSVSVLDNAPTVQFNVAADTSSVQFPKPALIKAVVVAGSKAVGRASVSGQVTRPDGTSVPIMLFDDGLPGHGDDLANDGVYSNFFSAYTSSGAYSFALTVVAQNGVTVPGFEQNAAFVSQPVPQFERAGTASINVTGVQSLSPGAVTIATGASASTEQTVTAPHVDAYMLAFQLTAGAGDPIAVSRIRVHGTGTGNETNIVAVKLYLDADGDGAIDLSGTGATPLGVATYDADNGVAEFVNPLVVPANSTANLLVTYEITATATKVVSIHLIWLSAAFVSLGGFAWPRRSDRSAHAKPLLALLALLFLSGSILSCGGGGGGDGNDPTPPSSITTGATFRASVAPGDIVVTGSTSGRAVTVGGQKVEGPTVTAQ